jgi:hypothetical protein
VKKNKRFREENFFMDKKILSIISMTLLLVATTVMAHTEGDPFVTGLIAGQHIDSGDVSVWNDDENIYITYTTSDGWEITETHLYVGKNDPGSLTSAPGQFPYSDDNPYVIPLSEIDFYSMELTKRGKPTGKMVADGDSGVGCDDTVYIAAHAVVKKETIIIEAPYYASAVFDYYQGLRKDGTPVRPGRSVPEQGLEFESGQSENNFFSLGFGGWLIAEFNCDIRNAEGNDIKIIEDTWGPGYPLEKADVYASQDGTNWVYLGEADNTNQAGIHTISEFDLNGLEWARYIKVVDTSDPNVHNNAADGYDLNAIEVLHDCVEIQEETAWGDEGAIPFGTNWAMYFEYTIQCEEELECPTITGSQGIEILSEPLAGVKYGDSIGSIPKIFAEYVESDHGGFVMDIDSSNNINIPGGHPVQDGTPICSYYVHFDDANPDHDQGLGHVTFSAPVMGLIVAGTYNGRDIFYNAGLNTLCDTNSILGNVATDYGSDSTCGMLGDARGLEIFYSNPAHGGNQDPISISGNTVNFDLNIYDKHDAFRIILPA